MMLDFELARPTSLAEAIMLTDTDDPTVRPFAGGTALMLMMKTGVFWPSVLVDLAGIEAEHQAITAADDGGLRIGAMAMLSSIERDAQVARIAPVIPRAMKRLSNVRVRNAARIGGNLAHGDPHMDMPPILAALGGSVVTRGPEGSRTIPVEELFTGYYETVLGQGELIEAVLLPAQGDWRSAYRKVTVRTHDDWPTLGVAAAVRRDGNAIAEVRLMISAATEKLTRAAAAEDAARSGGDPEAAARAAGDAAAESVETIDDSRGSAAYKKELVRVEVRRAILEALGQGASA